MPTEPPTNSDDYVYDDKGNLVVNLKKNAKDHGGVAGVNGIRYNFLDKPEGVYGWNIMVPVKIV